MTTFAEEPKFEVGDQVRVVGQQFQGCLGIVKGVFAEEIKVNLNLHTSGRIITFVAEELEHFPGRG